MALNLLPLKLCDCANFALNDINEFTKGQGYAVSKFGLKTDNHGRGRRGSTQTSSRGGSSQISSSTALQITAQSTQSTPEQVGSITGGITGGVVEVKMFLQMACQVLAVIFHRLTAVVGPCSFRTTLLRGPLAHSSSNLNSMGCTIVGIKT